MSWLNVDDGMGDHPKTALVSNAALGLWLRLACHCARFMTDGYVPTAICSKYGTPDETRELVKAGLLDKAKGGYQLHDYLDWNKSRQQIEDAREASRKRVEAWRAKHPGNAVRTENSNGVRTRSTPLPSLKGRGARSPSGAPASNTPKCPTHMQHMPCISCAADRKAGGAA